MKLRLFATAALAAAAISAPAFAQTVGSVGVSAATTNVEVGNVEGDGQTYGVDGSVAFKAGENWTVSLKGAAAANDGDLGDDARLNGGAAVTFAGSDWRVGPFVEVTDSGDSTIWAAGGLAQKHLGNVTLAGAVGFGKIDDQDADLWGVNGEVRYFINDSFRLNGSVGYGKIDLRTGDVDAWSVGVGGEYQFASSPWSVFGGYQHAKINDADISSDTFKIGGRYSFGGDLKARDRSGADVPSLLSTFSGFGL